MAENLEAVGLGPMKEYFWRRQACIAEYISNIPIYELCTGAERILELSRLLWWWDQDLNWEKEGNGASEGAEREVA